MTIHLSDLDNNAAMRSATEVRSATSKPQSSRNIYIHGLKRVFDITAVVIMLPIVLPVILILAAFISLNGGQPFYCQMRVGRDGNLFRMWKLRTMLPDAKERLEAYLEAHPEARAEWHNMQKLKDDPRITPIGHILRKASIDELPQIFNVLNGTMSLVGPRPMMPEQQIYYRGSAYYDLRPGITGFWQISERNDCEFADRARHDDAYYDVISLGTDLKVIFRTIFVVLRGTGY